MRIANVLRIPLGNHHRASVAKTKSGLKAPGAVSNARPRADLTRHGAQRKNVASGPTVVTFSAGAETKEGASAELALIGMTTSTLANRLSAVLAGSTQEMKEHALSTSTIKQSVPQI